VAGGRWLVAGGWWPMAGGLWLVADGWWSVYVPFLVSDIADALKNRHCFRQGQGFLRGIILAFLYALFKPFVDGF